MDPLSTLSDDNPIVASVAGFLLDGEKEQDKAGIETLHKDSPEERDDNDGESATNFPRFPYYDSSVNRDTMVSPPLWWYPPSSGYMEPGSFDYSQTRYFPSMQPPPPPRQYFDPIQIGLRALLGLLTLGEMICFVGKLRQQLSCHPERQEPAEDSRRDIYCPSYRSFLVDELIVIKDELQHWLEEPTKCPDLQLTLEQVLYQQAPPPPWQPFRHRHATLPRGSSVVADYLEYVWKLSATVLQSMEEPNTHEEMDALCTCQYCIVLAKPLVPWIRNERLRAQFITKEGIRHWCSAFGGNERLIGETKTDLMHVSLRAVLHEQYPLPIPSFPLPFERWGEGETSHYFCFVLGLEIPSGLKLSKKVVTKMMQFYYRSHASCGEDNMGSDVFHLLRDDLKK